MFDGIEKNTKPVVITPLPVCETSSFTTFFFSILHRTHNLNPYRFFTWFFLWLEKLLPDLCFRNRVRRVGYFPGGPVIKTLPSSATGASLTWSRSWDLTWLVTKNQNIKQKQYYSKFNKDLKMVHIRKKKKEFFEKKKVNLRIMAHVSLAPLSSCHENF